MTTPTFGGDEVNALVIDVGSYQCKAGYAGEDTPKAVFGTAVGEIPEDKRPSPMDTDQGPSTAQENNASQGEKAERPQKRKRIDRGLRVLNSAHTRPLDHQVVLQTLQNGIVSDWELWETIIDEALTQRLRIKPEDHPMLLAEPSYTSKDSRERVVERMFEDFNAPAVFLAKNAVLSSFAIGRQTSLVVDLGHEGCVVAAVHDGYLVQQSIVRAPMGGRLLQEALLKSLTAKGYAIHPWYMYTRVPKVAGAGLGLDVMLAQAQDITPSHITWATSYIVSDVKESHCRVSENPFVEEENQNMPMQSYELPDGSTVDIGAERFSIPEILFNPRLLRSIPAMRTVTTYSGQPLSSVPEMVIESVNQTDVDIRKELFNGVVLTGGSSLFNGMKERIDRELLDMAPQNAKVKVNMLQNATERKYSVWLGGSILGSLGSFHQLWMSRQEYDENGPGLIHRKSP